MILGVYALIMSSFLLLFARDMEAGLVVAISGVYFTVYLGVPAVFFRTEAGSRNTEEEFNRLAIWHQSTTNRYPGQTPSLGIEKCSVGENRNSNVHAN